jgi:hypothetical protein
MQELMLKQMKIYLTEIMPGAAENKYEYTNNMHVFTVKTVHVHMCEISEYVYTLIIGARENEDRKRVQEYIVRWCVPSTEMYRHDGDIVFEDCRHALRMKIESD